MAKKFDIPKIYSRGTGFRIPLCSDCGEEMVIYKKQWVCKDCMLIPVRGEFGKTEKVPFGELFLNRAQRRAK